MRWLTAIATLVVLLAARDARASCDGCCSNSAELLGWSKDGRTYIIKDQVGTSPQFVVLRDGKEIERWGGDADDECLSMIGRVKPPMPADTFARHKVDRLQAAWRDAFKADYRIVAGKKPVMLGQAKCTGTDVVDATGKIATSLVRQCDPNETECIRTDTLGGYLHPSKEWILVKHRTHSCGYRSFTGYTLVKA